MRDEAGARRTTRRHKNLTYFREYDTRPEWRPLRGNVTLRL
jgi:hypothetical protein